MAVNYHLFMFYLKKKNMKRKGKEKRTDITTKITITEITTVPQLVKRK